MMEKESDGRIAFLDVLVERKGRKLSTGVYRKKTHTDQHNFLSHHYPRVISCLRNRAVRVCDDEYLKTEMIHLRKTFRANSYQSGLVSKRLHQWNHSPPSQDDTTTREKPTLLYLPYIEHTSVKTVFMSSGTLQEYPRIPDIRC